MAGGKGKAKTWNGFSNDTNRDINNVVYNLMICNLHHIFIHVDLGDIRLELYLEKHLKNNEIKDLFGVL